MAGSDGDVLVQFGLQRGIEMLSVVVRIDDIDVRVDVVAGRFGKSSGGFFEIVIIALAGAMSEAIVYFALFFVVFSLLWIASVIALNSKFLNACRQTKRD